MTSKALLRLAAAESFVAGTLEKEDNLEKYEAVGRPEVALFGVAPV